MMFSEDYVYVAISSGLLAYRTLASNYLDRNWVKIPPVDIVRCSIALDYMGDVAKNPAKYFARAYTIDEWKKRENMANTQTGRLAAESYYTYYIAGAPHNVVYSNAKNALLTQGLRREYYKFCMAIKEWEYDRMSKNPSIMARQDLWAQTIINMANDVLYRVNLAQKNVFVRTMHKMAHHFQYSK